MRILIAAISHYCDGPGGGSRIAFEEAKELASQGEDVWVLAPGLPEVPEHRVIDGVHLLRYVPADTRSWDFRRATTHQRAAADVLNRNLPSVDAIHGHMPLQYLAALNFYKAPVHTVYTIHSPAEMEMAIVWSAQSLMHRITSPLGLALIHRMEAECLRRSRVLTALSRYTISCIGKLHSREVAERIRLVPGWVDTDRFTPIDDRQAAKASLGWPTDKPVLFTLRRLAARMGLDRLISAANILRKEGMDFHLMIGGTGPFRSSLEKQTRVYGLQDRVSFLGRVEDRILPLCYAACDAFILPTTQLECFGLIALEGLSAGRPVLATPVAAIPEIIGQIEPMWLAKSATAEDIASLIRSYLRHQLPEHPARDLHDSIERKYQQKNVVARYLNESFPIDVRSV